MKKSTIWVIVGVLGVGAVGYYLFNKMKDKKDKTSPSPAPSPTPIPDVSGYEDYLVVTTRDPLNVRQNPDSVAKVVGSLAKGSTIKGKPSGVAGWLQVSNDGITPIGYSSETYLRKA